MGATIDLFLEYDDSCAEPFSAAIDGVIDFTKSVNSVYCKPYSLMQAIAGVRGDSEINPKFPPRGFPRQMNHFVTDYLADSYGLDYKCAGWLLYQELIESLQHARLCRKELPDSIQLFIDIFEMVKDKYGEARVRMVFAISSP
jgi:hypothetical protein